MNISDEAVKALAAILVEEGAYGVPWWDASTTDRAEAIGKARRYLTIAAPHMQADADLMRWKLDALKEWSDAMINESSSPQYGRDVKTLLEIASLDEAKEVDFL